MLSFIVQPNNYLNSYVKDTFKIIELRKILLLVETLLYPQILGKFSPCFARKVIIVVIICPIIIYIGDGQRVVCTV